MNYIFDNAVEAETAQRFGSLDALYNPRTFRFLEAAGIAPGCKCLEVGGGSGAVAAWMADRVGPQGSVLITDIEPRFIERSACHAIANVELRRHDIGLDPLPESAFDLVHARLVLLHVPQRHLALERMIRSLRPGGRLVIEEFDPRLVDRTTPLPNDPRATAFKRVVDVLFRLMVERGFDADWPRGLYRRFRASGLIDVGMEGHVAVREGGSAGAALDAANLAQIRKEAVIKGLVTDAEVDAGLAALGAADFAAFSPIMFTAWGRRPGIATKSAETPKRAIA